MAEGDIEALLDLYDSDAVFLDQSGEIKKGRPGLRESLVPMALAKAKFDFRIKQMIPAGDIVLMHTEWKTSAPQPMYVYAIEVARRQPDGGWCWLIGDPFTVGRPTLPMP